MKVLNPHKKPLAFVGTDGFIIPNPTFTAESLRHINGRFIYTERELELAMEDMNILQDERRAAADYELGADAVNVDITEYETIGEAVDDHLGQRETVPSMTASPERKRKTSGVSKKLTQPNVAPLPETLDMPQKGMNLTDEERDDLVGIDTTAAVAAMFGNR